MRSLRWLATCPMDLTNLFWRCLLLFGLTAVRNGGCWQVLPLLVWPRKGLAKLDKILSEEKIVEPFEVGGPA